jgi:predicted AlkP superfamily pyrophosphatase or phosphodiesterase
MANKLRTEMIGRRRACRGQLLLAFLLVSHCGDTFAADTPQRKAPRPAERVLLLSIDGMHGLDLSNYIRSRPDSALARLSKHGVTYTNAHSSLPSNSWPGLLAIVTGGSPISTGVLFENNYDRSLSPPHSNCASVGSPVVYDGSIDNPAGDGIDARALPLDPSKGCKPVFPHSYVRVNNIFEVVKGHGGRTAWSDKHPAYEALNGPSGNGIDDLFTPEIHATIKARSVQKTEEYDDTKVSAIVYEIEGKDHTGLHSTRVPELFGMNFQSISMAQKMEGNGYLDGNGTPSAGLVNAFDHTDRSISRIVDALQREALFNSTLIVITAKHGDGPIDPERLRLADLDWIPGVVKKIDPGLLLSAEQDGSIAMLWLRNHEHTDEVAAALRKGQFNQGIQQVFSGASLRQLFNDPMTDPRMPDIIIQPNPGTIYAEASDHFIEEHGGFADDDTHVALLLSLPGMNPKEVKSIVQTAQIAPTILEQLGIDPRSLEAVVKEHTPTLPGLALSFPGHERKVRAISY